MALQWTFLFGASNKLCSLLSDMSFDAPAIVPNKKDEDNIIYKVAIIFLSKISRSNLRRFRIKPKEIINQLEIKKRKNI